MTISWKLGSDAIKLAFLAAILAFVTPLVQAQSASAPQQTQTSPHAVTPSQSAPQSTPAERKPDAGAPPQDQASVAPEKKISAAEAQELLKSVDEILQFVSNDTGLPIKHPVKRQLAQREQVVKYLEDRMKEDKDTERMEKASTTLKKFGLLPRDFNLRPYLLELLKEQVAGFYDARTKTVYLLDWVEPEAQRPVLAHELTHALQDQSLDMEKWTEISTKEMNNTDSAARDEERSARQAVLEGQAMVVLIDYTLAPVGKSTASSPDLVEAMKNGMSTDGASPIFTRSPLFLREALVFPYTWGLDFVRQVMQRKGREAAFVGTLKNPPEDTRQIMEPATYVAEQSLGQMPLPDLKNLIGKDLDVFDTGGIGEFDVYVMLKQWTGTKAADDRSRTWRGGYYITAHNTKDQSAAVSLVFTSKWASSEDAIEFAKLYAQGLGKRYRSVKPVRRDDNGLSALWNTEDGPVELEIRGNTMVATEGFEGDKAKALRNAAFAKATNGGR